MANTAELLRFEQHPFAGAYTIREAAEYLRATTPPPDIPIAMWVRRTKQRKFVASSQALYAWVRRGLDWDEPLTVSSRDRVVVFEDLIRLRMISILRSRGFSFAEISDAEAYAKRTFQLTNPFVTEPLWTAVSHIFMEWADHLVAISHKGQIALPDLREILTPAYHGLTFSRSGVARQWRPHSLILMDPEVQFGAPCIEGTRIATETVWSLHQAGDSEETIAGAYGLEIHQIKAAIEWQRLRADAA